MEKVIFNCNFAGSYDLFKYIIQTYRDELPYNGLIKNFVIDNNYSETTHISWACTAGVNARIWNTLQKDLTIAWLCGRIKDKPFDLGEIKRQFLDKTRSGN